MWSFVNKKIKLDISKVKDSFKKIYKNNFILIYPDKGSFPEYTEDEKKLRSIIVDQDGFVVSSCWPKFGNWGEFKNDTDRLIDQLPNGTIRFSRKEDGSLCIRSIINGEVIFRTRGTMFGGETIDEEKSFGERFKKVVSEKYPILLDSNWMQDRSLLFEYVSPDNLIVQKYENEDLIFLGYVLHKDLSLGKWEDLEKISLENNFNLVELFNLPRDPSKLIEEIKQWREEGVVVRCCDDQVFVKIKSDWYILNHRIKSHLNYNSILELLNNNNLFFDKSEERFVDLLKENGFDWELIESCKEYFKKYLELYVYAESVLKASQDIYEKFMLDNINVVWESEKEKRKEFAKIAVSFENPYRPMLFSVYEKNEKSIKELIRKLIYN